ncbi:MAG: hypothetical protein E7335_01285 [Clostridiales bacterium]|nr:hypothetical protein [Clostridiales bacterium]
MDILFVSDYVCPYCLVAKEALRRALAITGIDADITWQPFELTPEPRPQIDTYHDDSRRAGYQILVDPCKEMGLDMKLPPNVVPRPYTRLAFEGWYYACDHGKGDEYDDLTYRTYFMDEKNIGDIAVLRTIAEKIGLDGDDFVSALENGVYTEKEKAAISYARNEIKPIGVPAMYINGKKVSIGNYTMREMIRLLTDNTTLTDDSYVCSEDGCGDI